MLPVRLAAGSFYRTGTSLEVIPSEADESFPPEWEPERIVSELALRKAEAVLPLAGERDAIIVGSDTIVVLDGRVLGKPVDAEDSRAMLAALQGRSHKVYTGVACIKLGDGRNDTLRPEVTDNSGSQSVRLGTLDNTVFSRNRLMASLSLWPVIRKARSRSGRCRRKKSKIISRRASHWIRRVRTGYRDWVRFVEKIEGDFYSVMGLPLNLLYQMLLKYNVCPFKIG